MTSELKPDWEGFGRDLMQDWPTGDIEGSELFEAALRNGLICEVPGGYDPEQHIDAEGICPETGDPWYEYAFGPTRAAAPAPAVDPMSDPRVVALVEDIRIIANNPFIRDKTRKSLRAALAALDTPQ